MLDTPQISLAIVGRSMVVGSYYRPLRLSVMIIAWFSHSVAMHMVMRFQTNVLLKLLVMLERSKMGRAGLAWRIEWKPVCVGANFSVPYKAYSLLVWWNLGANAYVESENHVGKHTSLAGNWPRTIWEWAIWIIFPVSLRTCYTEKGDNSDDHQLLVLNLWLFS